ncbi:hypothetical protein P20652_3273 [Pseudoalteromonas sp. BSi20652]|uniref:hypothetical protein n=1 Tax=Pseudoalteromonas sp. BSi20652 TaxID=388384 RepID=UPI000231A698|nr:hypothetical protein [Pseudoalteromonas sp. BSi20652]GAA61396.1 hypothetical protein P20652_3273 [Pseudoalteromonas sp. BSi20652]
MKKILFVYLLIVSSLSYAEAEKENTVTETTKSMVSGLVKFSKDLIEGADEGVDEGRKTGLSQDGAVLIDNGTDLEKYLSIKLLNVNKESDTVSSIELGFKNSNEHPVRVINLVESENIIAIDIDGYATNLAKGEGNPLNVTIPSKAGKKQKFYFELAPDSIKEIRIMGKVYTK